MFKSVFLQALLASLLAFTAAIIYRRIYFFATEVDFSRILGTVRLAGFSLFICMLAAIVRYGLTRWLKKWGELWFNLFFSLFTFALVMVPISITLPLNVQFPELFPGLGVPVVFFPAMAWYTVNPWFNLEGKSFST